MNPFGPDPWIVNDWSRLSKVCHTYLGCANLNYRGEGLPHAVSKYVVF